MQERAALTPDPHGAPGTPVSPDADEAELIEAESIVNLRDLSFGTVSGICVGVFVKKGLRVRVPPLLARHSSGTAHPPA